MQCSAALWLDDFRTVSEAVTTRRWQRNTGVGEEVVLGKGVLGALDSEYVYAHTVS